MQLFTRTFFGSKLKNFFSRTNAFNWLEVDLKIVLI